MNVKRRYDNLYEAMGHIDKMGELLNEIDRLTGSAEVYRIRVDLSHLHTELYSEAKGLSQVYREEWESRIYAKMAERQKAKRANVKEEK